ncbi:MAG: hypothetical protein EPN65_16625 [Pandoraea sp.]|uniref:hypothetical protein n=1 Tax=Pandoraea sp. TaxID=1883445 RepID=UPI001217DC7D|nr:hypothetical protein [Pandoraea sp.]TAM15938.1 MAG: hypothetical protein EPN65_16625 [Pandoraea sp.]
MGIHYRDTDVDVCISTEGLRRCERDNELLKAAKKQRRQSDVLAAITIVAMLAALLYLSLLVGISNLPG